MTGSTLTREAVEKFVVDTLEELGAERSEIVPSASFEDLGVDSLDVTDLGASVKREFAIELRARDFEEALLVQDALAVIYAKAGL
ncbi:acyl carrier protein [Kitasatospora sp. NPDC057015]|uniref:acyl carrier protein n=1 Tax=Kitasatospora sp. NPDC057015 TaxID=3346001 RepID=UPI00364340B0